MTETFNRPGAIDLSQLTAQRANSNQQASSGATVAGYVEAVTEANFQSVMAKSLKHPVILEVTTTSAPQAVEMSNALKELAAEAAGRFLLAVVDIEKTPAIAQALQLQGVPALFAIIGGQLAPLGQGVQPKEVLAKALDQVYQAAMANGVMGKAEPVSTSSDSDGEMQPGADPRLAAAYAAMESENFEQAVAEFDKVLVEHPNLAEAKAGRAQAALVVRTASLKTEEVAALGDSLEAVLVKADVAILGGAPQQAFDALLNYFALANHDDREVIRTRLIEYFDLFGPSDALVMKARRRLTTLLY